MARLALRGLLAHKLRLGLTALAVILSVGFVSGTMILSATLDKSIGSAFSDLGRGTDAVVRTQRAVSTELGTDAPDRPVPASLLATIQSAPGVAKVHGEVTGFAGVVDKKGKIYGSPPQTGRDWNADPDLSPMRLKSGTGPRAADEIALDQNTADATGYKAGDRVQVVLASGVRTFTVSGVFQYGSSDALSALVVTAFQPQAAERLLMEHPGTYRQISVHAAPGVSQTELRDAIARVLPSGYEAVTGTKAIDEQTASVKDVLKMLRTFVLVFAFVAVFVGSFIIFNTFSMLVSQRTRELALLRAIGASRRQVTLMVMGEALGVGFLGSTIGLLAGGGLGLGLIALFGALDFGVPAGDLTLPPMAVLWSYAVGMLVTLVGAYLPASRAARIPPVAAMRDDAVAASGRSLRLRAIAGTIEAVAGAVVMAIGFGGSGDAALVIAGGGAAALFIGITTLSPIVSRPATRLLGWPFARIAGVTGRMSRENAQRNPRRTAATASALMIGLTLVSGVSVISASMVASTDRQVDEGLTADYRIDAPSSLTPLSTEVRDAVAKTPGVRDAIGVATAPFKLDGKASRATAGDAAGLVRLYRLRIEAGSSSLGPDQLLVNRKTADDRGWKVGSAVPGQYQDGTRATFRIAGIYADVKSVLETAPTIILGAGSYAEHYSDAQIDQIDIIKAPGTDAAAVERALRGTLDRWPNLDLKNREQIKEQYTASIDLLLRVVLVLLALSIVIAALGIVNTLALSVVERTREIGLLRAIGMQRGQVRRMIRFEAVVISTFGALLGLAVGVVIAVSIQNAAADEGMDVLSVPVGQLALYVLASALIGVVAAVWPARRASTMDVLRAIGSTE
ncbi:ABC transporter permease [Actinomadura geliboluensis]|uniref:ABC transporter permease n=1 Tax=Actinomadura geliboluensis TaxID=882440 RepID=UPI00371EC485